MLLVLFGTLFSWFCCFTVFAVATNNEDEDGSHKNVQVSLRGQFNQFPLIYEIAEYFNDNDLFSQFMDEYLSDFYPKYSNQGSKITEKDVYNWVVTEYIPSVSDIIGNAKIESFELAMAIHYYTSKLAMFDQEWKSAFSQCNNNNNGKMTQMVMLPNMMCYPITTEKDSNDIINEIKKIDKTKESSLMVFNEIDHKFGNCNENNENSVIFYGDYTNKLFKSLHKSLLALSNNNNDNSICYVLRPICLSNVENGELLNLNGFGVELAIKNMEYKVLDDRKIEQIQVNANGETSNADDAASSQLHKQVEIDPIVISTHAYLQKILLPLIENDSNPAKKPNLLEMEEEAMKEYMSDLDVQATFALVNAFHMLEDENQENKDINNEYLKLFREFSNDFPRYVFDIAHVPKESYKYLLEYVRNLGQYMRGGHNSLTLNGIQLQTDDSDIFSLYKTIVKESEFIDNLTNIFVDYNKNDASYQMDNDLMTALLSTPLNIGSAGGNRRRGMMPGQGQESPNVRIDMRDASCMKISGQAKVHGSGDGKTVSLRKTDHDCNSAVLWINNIERDSEYRRFPAEVRNILSRMMMLQLIPIRKNLYNVIAIFDPSDYESLTTFSAIHGMLQQGLAFRFGMVFYPNKLINELNYIMGNGLPITNLSEESQVSRRIIQCITWILDYYVPSLYDEDSIKSEKDKLRENRKSRHMGINKMIEFFASLENEMSSKLESKQSEIAVDIIKNYLPTIMDESEIALLKDSDLTFENFPQLMMDPEIQVQLMEAMSNIQESGESESLFKMTQENVINAMNSVFSKNDIKKSNPKKKGATIENFIFELHISEYLDFVQAYLNDKGLPSYLKSQSLAMRENDEENEATTESDSENENENEKSTETTNTGDGDENEKKSKKATNKDSDNIGLALSINGAISIVDASEFNGYTLMGQLMQEQQQYAMLVATGKVTQKTNFNDYVYDQPDVLSRFSNFLLWHSNAGNVNQLKTIELNNEKLNNINLKAFSKAMTVLHPSMLKSNYLPNEMDYASVILPQWKNKTKFKKLNNISIRDLVHCWLVVDTNTIVGTALLESFYDLNVNEFRKEVPIMEVMPKETQDEIRAQLPQFGIKFALFDNHDSSNGSNNNFHKYIEYIRNRRENGGEFSWENFNNFVEYSRVNIGYENHASNGGDSSSKPPPPCPKFLNCNNENGDSSKRNGNSISEMLGIEKGKNYLFVNGMAIPLDHLVDEATGTKQTNNGDGGSEPKRETSPPINGNDIYSLISKLYEENENIYDQLFNVEYGILDGTSPNININSVITGKNETENENKDETKQPPQECSAMMNLINEQFNINIGNTLIRIVNLLYYRRLSPDSKFVVRPNTVWNLLNNGENNEQTEELRSTVESLSVNLVHSSDEFDENKKMKGIFELCAVLDPLSPNTQKMISMLYKLYNYNDLFNVKILFNPILEMKDQINRYGLPTKLTRYYRYVLNTNLHFDENNNNNMESFGLFVDMPQEQVLTLGIVDTPGTWLYESLVGTYDLDNLLLSKTDSHLSTIFAEYQLEHVLIQGQCFDEAQSPVAGLQLQLFDIVNNTAISDTIVMENLGYFQLKSNPGIWKLSLRDGRSSQVFKFDTKEMKIANPSIIVNNDENSIIIPHSKMSGSPIRIRVKKRVGMEKEELLPKLTQEERMQQRQARNIDRAKDKARKKILLENENEEDDKKGGIKSIWNNIFGSGDNEEDADADGSAVGSSDETEVDNRLYSESGLLIRPDAKPANETTLHVMSVASGHLYERFLKIMMISVLRNTEAKHVKFWFFGQFLSPRFKKFIPYFTEKYNCSIELVTYRWPEWLRAQSEKQRIIWAYKILFLDVLFPLDLERIIFVDADQIVRGDLLELWNLDLQGSPYGYTPFCDSNLETEGFRFWKQGYWNNHLKGKPYHISALYVVDLTLFRRMRAGDSLRILYDQLSADPNSLANLDQDLPNFAQHMVPIYSLPQEWLWCETWCDMDSLNNAKTIDLCNNPLTKEPKLEKAKRLLPEWEQIDNEVTTFENKLIEKGVLEDI